MAPENDLTRAIERARQRAAEAEHQLASDAAPPRVRAAVARTRKELDALAAELTRDSRAA